MYPALSWLPTCCRRSVSMRSSCLLPSVSVFGRACSYYTVDTFSVLICNLQVSPSRRSLPLTVNERFSTFTYCLLFAGRVWLGSSEASCIREMHVVFVNLTPQSVTARWKSYPTGGMSVCRKSSKCTPGSIFFGVNTSCFDARSILC